VGYQLSETQAMISLIVDKLACRCVQYQVVLANGGAQSISACSLQAVSLGNGRYVGAREQRSFNLLKLEKELMCHRFLAP